MTSLAQLIGDQRPRIETAGEGAGSKGALVAELAGLVGLTLDDWQTHVLDVGLRHGDGGQWTHRTVVELVARQNGKSAGLKALLLGYLTLFDARRVTYSTQNLGVTTVEMIDELEEMLRHRALGYGRAVARTRNNGREALTLPNGNRVRFLARSAGAGRGTGNALVVLDEGYSLTERHLSAVTPTQAAVANPQLWVVSSAPLEDSEPLHRLRNLGHRGANGLALMEWSADPDADRADPRTWAQANPGLGIRISTDFLAHALSTMDPRSFDVEHLGIPADDGGSGLIDAATWDALADARSTVGPRQSFALDASPDGLSAALSVASRRPDGLVHVETVEHLQGLSWVEGRCAEVLGRRKRSTLSIDPSSPAGQFIAPLRAGGIEVVEVQRPELAKACASFVQATRDGTLRHLGQASILRALPNARRRAMGDAWIWSRASSTTDICPLVAATMAHWAVVGEAKRRRRAINL